MFLSLLSEVLTFLTVSSKQHKFDPPPDTPQPTTPPTNIHIPTSRKRQDSMKIARMNSRNHAAVVQEPPAARDAGVWRTDTGFPEPLSPDRNTTLPHPDADTSENATIEAEDDGPVMRTHSRGSFFRGRGHAHRSTNSGKIDPGELGRDDHIRDADGTEERKRTEAVERHTEEGGDLVQPLTNSTESVEGSKNEEELVAREGKYYKARGRRKGVLRKLNLHKV